MISLITTVLNEKKNIAEWLASFVNQTKTPDEIIIVDGGSDDGTWEWLQEQAYDNPVLRIFQEKGNIAHGRNIAITQARGSCIVVADAGCTYLTTWFEKITAPVIQMQAQLVTTAFGPWLKKEDNLKAYLIAAATIPAKHEFEKDWLPSSRSVAFQKAIWEKVQGYPEWLPICEDIVFDLAVQKLGIKTTYIRESLVLWRPRAYFASYFKQLFYYTRGDGHARLFFGRQIIRYGTYIVSLGLCIAGIIHPGFWIVLISGALMYNYKFWKRWIVFTVSKSIQYKSVGIILLPIVIVLGDIAKMCGWPVGVYERWVGKINQD